MDRKEVGSFIFGVGIMGTFVSFAMLYIGINYEIRIKKRTHQDQLFWKTRM